MENNEIKEKIRKILVSVLKHERFSMIDELKASDIDGWDSLTHMFIITAIEEEFKIKFKLKELNKLQNIGSFVELVKSKIQ
jgi:acyl carrier protein